MSKYLSYIRFLFPTPIKGLIAITLLSFLLAIGIDHYFQRNDRLNIYLEKLEQYLHQQEIAIDAFLDDQAFIFRIVSNQQYVSSQQKKDDYRRLMDLSEEDFTIAFFREDSLIFWSNNAMLPDKSAVRSITTPERMRSFATYPNGWYEQITQRFEQEEIGAYTMVALIPIKFNYELISNYLSNEFATDYPIPQIIQLSSLETNYPLKTHNGKVLCFLESNDVEMDVYIERFLFALYSLAFFLLAILIHYIAKGFFRQDKALYGGVFLISSVFGLRLVSILLDWTSRFDSFSLFAKNFDGTISNSLGDLLLNIILLLWIMVFFHKEAKTNSYDHLKLPIRFAITTGSYFSILIGILVITTVFRTLVFNTAITFDFENVFNLDKQSLVALFGVILLLIALFLFGHRMMISIAKVGLNRYYRLLGLCIATLAISPFLFTAKLMLPSMYLLMIAFVFILIFDLFIDSTSVNFTWLVIWLIILSAFPSILLFRYNLYKDRIVRSQYAIELSSPRDSLAEAGLSELYHLLQSDHYLRRELSDPDSVLLNYEALRKKVNHFFTEETYLYYNYDYKIYAFNKYGQPAFPNQEESLNTLTDHLRKSNKINSNLYFRHSQSGNASYVLPVSFKESNSSFNKLNLFFEFSRQRRDQSKVYTELLVDRHIQQYKNLKSLDRYEFAIYKNFSRIDQQGNIYGPILTLTDLPPVGVAKEFISGNRSELIYSAEDGITVIIGRKKEQINKAVSLFSYIFGTLITIVLLLGFINHFTRIFPTLGLSIGSSSSLKNRIQLAVVALIIISFIIIGIITIWFFQTSTTEYHAKRLERKTEAVLKDATLRINERIGDPDFTLPDILSPLSKIHRLDINLYDLDGSLISSSNEDIYSEGIISRKMNTLAFQGLTRFQEGEFTQENEKIGKLAYKSAYVPLKIDTEEGETTIAYLGLPYYSSKGSLRSDVTVFMSTLINVYVFLFLFAGGVAIAVSNSITRPLAKLGEKLRQFKLGKRNEPLEWKNKDEIGALIEQYNEMIGQLDESATRLASSEREGAWREMAKQVAHEIKNPLTPMKLSIQYLQHAYRSNPDDIEPLMKRVASTLIEQIDNLAQIASEFSNFAKMPRAENQKIALNELVESVFELFSQEGVNESIDLQLHLPNENYFVYADKNHLMRVFNNLIKNAIQAIPDSREGQIAVLLRRESDTAVIQVRDNGVGIPDDKQDKVFVPNFTTKSSGTGLGLAISKNIIEAVNGRIFFETKVGIGTDFFVILPLVEVKKVEFQPQ